MAKCARCEKEMERLEAGGIELDKCPSCGGIWFDGSELARVLELSPGELDGLGDSLNPKGREILSLDLEPAFCPRCSAALSPQRFDFKLPVIIDFCPAGHGVWLDRGELRRIEDFCRELEAELARMPPLPQPGAEDLDPVKIKENLADGERALKFADGITKVGVAAFYGAAMALDWKTGTFPWLLLDLLKSKRGCGPISGSPPKKKIQWHS